MQATRYNSKNRRGGGGKKGKRWFLSRIHCEPITVASKMDSYDWPSSQETRQMEGLAGEKKGFIVVQLLGCVRLFVTPGIAAHQASLSFTISQSLLNLILCHPLLLPSINYQMPINSIKDAAGFFFFNSASVHSANIFEYLLCARDCSRY